jgi:hypothetical protein
MRFRNQLSNSYTMGSDYSFSKLAVFWWGMGVVGWLVSCGSPGLDNLAADKAVIADTEQPAPDQGGTPDTPPVDPTATLTVLTGPYSFDGQTHAVEVPDQPFLHFGEESFSISAWIKTASQTDLAVILDKRVETSGPLRGYVVANYNGKLLLQLADANGRGWTNYESAAFIADDQWHHIAITVDRQAPDGIRYYVDGQEVGPRANPTGRSGSLTTTVPLTIGRRSDHPNWPGYFRGSLADVALFRSVLTPEQIEALAAARAETETEAEPEWGG